MKNGCDEEKKGRDKDGLDSEDDGLRGLGDDLFGTEEKGLEDSGKEGDQDGKEGVQDVPGTVPEAGAGKRTWKNVTVRQKAVNVILRRAAKDAVPDVRQLLVGKCGTVVRIADIALFIGDGQGDELMAELAKECPIRNRVNLSAEVQKRRMLDIGAQIVESGRMYQPISVARIKEDGRLECTSGRHRLAFLVLMYGGDTRIPVYIEDMTMNEARDAVVVSNQARSTKALERAEHAVLQAVRGNVDADQDDLYYKTVTAKAKARRYCVFSVVNRGFPRKLAFAVSSDSSRKGGATTLANVECFWGAALGWEDGMERKVFDADLGDSVRFLNAMVERMLATKGFEPKQHLAAMTMTAVGKYYRNYKDIAGSVPVDVADKVAACVVKMGEIGRVKSEKTYSALAKALVPRKR